MKKFLKVLLIVMICMVPTIAFAGVMGPGPLIECTWWDLYPSTFILIACAFLVLGLVLELVDFVSKKSVKLKESKIKKISQVIFYVEMLMLIIFLVCCFLLFLWITKYEA